MAEQNQTPPQPITAIQAMSYSQETVNLAITFVNDWIKQQGPRTIYYIPNDGLREACKLEVDHVLDSLYAPIATVYEPAGWQLTQPTSVDDKNKFFAIMRPKTR